MGRLILSAEAAELAGIAPSTWRAYVARGQAPAPRRHVGSTPQWDYDLVQRWVDSRPGPGARTDTKAGRRRAQGVVSRSTKKQCGGPN